MTWPLADRANSRRALVGIRVRRMAHASWQGDVPTGGGRISTESGSVDSPFTLRGREGDEPATNPEELIGAAHAGCFAMSLSNLLSEAGHPPEDVTARATVHLEQEAGGFSITRIELDVKGRVSGLDATTFAALARQAKETCPVSRALAGTVIVLVATLVGNAE